MQRLKSAHVLFLSVRWDATGFEEKDSRRLVIRLDASQISRNEPRQSRSAAQQILARLMRNDERNRRLMQELVSDTAEQHLS